MTGSIKTRFHVYYILTTENIRPENSSLLIIPNGRTCTNILRIQLCEKYSFKALEKAEN